MNTIVSPISRGQGHEFLNKLEAAGLNNELAQRVVDSTGNNLAAKVVRLIHTGGFELPMSRRRAREIMGKNFFGFEEVIQCFGVYLSKKEITSLAKIPFSEETLHFVKDTHILVAAFPMSILDIRGKVVKRKLFHCYEGSWYDKEAFAEDKGDVRWHLVKKTPVENSTSKNWDEQQALLGSDEETPSAQIVVYTIIGLFLATGEQLFKNICVRTSNFTGGSCGHVGVGFGKNRLRVSGWWDDRRRGFIGVSSARKF